jgi:MscS family membrane protein
LKTRLGAFSAVSPLRFTLGLLVAGCLLCCDLTCVHAGAQIPGRVQTPATAQPEIPTDPLGRNTPLGTVRGFYAVARKGNYEVASQYLNTRLRGRPARELAQKLFVVLDRRLPARLRDISDNPEGSLNDLPSPNQDLVGVVKAASGETNIIVERVDRGKQGQIWLFSRETLNSIPAIYDEISVSPLSGKLPDWLVNGRFASTGLYEWLGVLIGIPFVYLITTLLGRLIGVLVNLIRRLFHVPVLPHAQVLPGPARLILLGLVIRVVVSRASLSLLSRQFWVTAAGVVFIAGGTWLLIILTRWLEERVRQRMRYRQLVGADSMPRLLGGVVKALLVFVGFVVTLHYFGVNVTAALAGLGVGGIAVALAAQKTLENLIGGASIIFDQAMRVGEFVKVGDTMGTVEEIGLRSTRIRTLDRSMIRVPNGQLASATLESYSARDKFWLHPIIGLSYHTTAPQMHAVLDGIRKVLDRSPVVESDARVRILRFGPYSLDVEVFGYVRARDWNEFLEFQGELLLEMMHCVEAAGTAIAFPSQTIFLASDGEEDVRSSEAPSREKKLGGERIDARSA